MTYPLMADPPLDTGPTHRAIAVTLPPAAPAEAVLMPGWPGALAGVMAPDSPDGAPVPTAFRAWTWNLTGAPLTSPITLKVVAPAPAGRSAPTWTLAAFRTRTQYPVSADPPLLSGAAQRTSAEALPRVGAPILAGPGTVAGVTAAVGAE